MTIDVPVHHLPALERSLSSQGLAIAPYIKAGVQRWQLGPRTSLTKQALPETIIAAGIEYPLDAHGKEIRS